MTETFTTKYFRGGEDGGSGKGDAYEKPLWVWFSICVEFIGVGRACGMEGGRLRVECFAVLVCDEC